MGVQPSHHDKRDTSLYKGNGQFGGTSASGSIIYFITNTSATGNP